MKRRCKLYIILLLIFTMNSINAQHGCPTPYGGNHSTPQPPSYYWGWATTAWHGVVIAGQAVGHAGVWVGKGVINHFKNTGGGSSGGEGSSDEGDEGDGGDDGGFGEGDDDGGGDDFPYGTEIDWGAFYYGNLKGGTACEKKAFSVLTYTYAWKDYAAVMYKNTGDKRWLDYDFSSFGDMGFNDRAIFLSQHAYLCDPDLAYLALQVYEATLICKPDVDDIAKIVDYLRDKPQGAKSSDLAASSLHWCLEQQLGQEFADCVLPPEGNTDFDKINSAFKIIAYLNKDLDAKEWFKEHGCELIELMEGIPDCPSSTPNYTGISELTYVIDFLKLHDNTAESKALSNSIAKGYASLTAEEKAVLKELSTYFQTHDPTDPLWDIMQEQFLEILKEFVADLVPGGTAVLQGPALVEAMKKGDWLGAFYIAADIAINEADNFNPLAKTCSIALGSAKSYKLLKKVYEPFKQAAKLGVPFVTKFYNVLRNRLGLSVTDIRKKMDWKGFPDGTVMKDIDPHTFLEKLKEEFGAVEVMINPRKGTTIYKIGNLPNSNLCIFMELYPDSSTGYKWTIEFTVGPCNATDPSTLGTQFKIRF